MSRNYSKHHVYLLPYMVRKTGVEVLIGKKFCYNKRDGYIQNNLGQIVMLGGNTKGGLTNDQLIKEGVREFVEESGNHVNLKHTHLKRYTQFSIVYYRISTESEYKRLQVNRSTEKKYKELDKLKWLHLKYIIYLFNSKNGKNRPCYGEDVDKLIVKYIGEWKKYNWKMLYKRRFMEWVKKKDIKITDKDFYDIKHNQSKAKFYKHFYFYLKELIDEKSSTDWFYKGAKNLMKNFTRIEDSIARKNKK